MNVYKSNCINKALLFFVLFLIHTLVYGCSERQYIVKSPIVNSEKISDIKETKDITKGINVTIYKNKDGITYGFTVTGHSRYSQKGLDIVCAGVTILVYNAVNSLERFTNDRVEKEIIENGYAKCILPDLKNGKGSKEAIVLLKSTEASMRDIEYSYGSQYVKVTVIKE